MKNKNVKVIDEHNIDRSANVMFALELEGSEYVVYWVERDTESNNVFVSKVLRNIDGTYNMLNIDDVDKKEEVANIVKTLISIAVSDQNDKLVGTETTLANGKVAKFVSVSFNKEQHINVQKTYITTVKKEVTVVAEKYYDVVVEVPQVEAAAPTVTPIAEPVVETPAVVTPSVEVVAEPAVQPTPVVAPVQEVVMPSIPETPAPSVQEPTPAVVESITVGQPVVTPEPVVQTPVEVVPPVVETPKVEPTVVVPTPVLSEPVVATPVVEAPKSEPTVVAPTPVVPEPIQEVGVQPLVFNASKEKNLNAALGEVASSTTIPVENVVPVREFGVDEPVTQVVPEAAPAVAAVAQPVADTSNVASGTPTTPKSGGFANSKFFMVVAVAFFLASCIFLGYEVFNYFQLIK